MCSSFVEAIKKIGYEENKEFIVNGNTVGLTFDKPHTTQPITRTEQTDKINTNEK